MSKQLIFALMLLGHFVADYTLQGWLADGKQKSWWEKLVPNYEKSPYRFDHIVALICHSLYWAIVVCLPFYNHPRLLMMIIVNALAHAIVDDLKCNRRVISLLDDQAFHLLQIVGTYICGIYC